MTVDYLRVHPNLKIALLLLLFVASNALGQDNVNKNQMIGFGCYFGGQRTKTVIKVTELLNEKKYKVISDLLKTGHGGEKFLAVVSLEKLSSLGQYALSDSERRAIEKIKTSHEKVSVCSGCTYFDKVTLKKMFSQDNFLGVNWWLEATLTPGKSASQQR